MTQPKDFKLIGQKLPRVDVPAKSNGTAQFTLDVTFPGMLVAVLQRPLSTPERKCIGGPE